MKVANLETSAIPKLNINHARDDSNTQNVVTNTISLEIIPYETALSGNQEKPIIHLIGSADYKTKNIVVFFNALKLKH